MITYSEYHIRIGIGVSKLNAIVVFRIQYRKIVTTIKQGGPHKEMRLFRFKTKECAGIKNTGRCRRLLDIHAIRAGNCAGGERARGLKIGGRI